MDLVNRFWSHVNIRESGKCWYWTASLNKKGYGKFAFNGSWILAHRFAWTITNGEIPEKNEDGIKLFVLHSCGNPNCVNPKHLRLGTDSENQYDRWMGR